jgi:hypothetical protein
MPLAPIMAALAVRRQSSATGTRARRDELTAALATGDATVLLVDPTSAPASRR